MQQSELDEEEQSVGTVNFLGHLVQAVVPVGKHTNLIFPSEHSEEDEEDEEGQVHSTITFLQEGQFLDLRPMAVALSW